MADLHVLRHRPIQHHHLPPLWRHFFQMLAVMMVGMFAAAFIYLSVIGMYLDRALRAHPMGTLLVVAAGMTFPMAAWMLHRGMGWRDSVEMSAAMAVPVLPFLCLVWGGITQSALCGPYCLSSLVAMMGLMLYRRDHYSMEMTAHH